MSAAKRLPEPLISIAVEPRSAEDRHKLGLAVSALRERNLVFEAATDHESGQYLLQGETEQQLEAVVDRLRREFHLEIAIGSPQVAYRETITRVAEIRHTHKNLTGGAERYASVTIRFEPLPPGSGFEFKNSAIDDNVPPEYIPSIEKGLQMAMNTGVVAGFPVIDFRAELLDGKYHDIDSSVRAFEIAARAAFTEGITKGAPVLLEPVMYVEIDTPEVWMGDIISDLHTRRAIVTGMDTDGDTRILSALAPLANMFDYASILRSIAKGLAQFTMQFDHYEPILPFEPPPDVFPPAVGLRQ